MPLHHVCDTRIFFSTIPPPSSSAQTATHSQLFRCLDEGREPFESTAHLGSVHRRSLDPLPPDVVGDNDNEDSTGSIIDLGRRSKVVVERIKNNIGDKIDPKAILNLDSGLGVLDAFFASLYLNLEVFVFCVRFLFPDGVGNIQIDCGSDIDSSSVGIRKNWLKLKQNWTCVYDANSQANGKNKPNGKFVRLHCFEVPVCLCGGGGRDSSMKESHGRSIFMQALHSQCATILMAAGDTFRAAASDQLGIWAERTGCEIVLAEKEKAKAPSM
ncbi:hypothetical protein L1887_12248 [Cichorium endivia]|nr:hypothetical protein L1887_12248 [Cichorium endivia]